MKKKYKLILFLFYLFLCFNKLNGSLVDAETNLGSYNFNLRNLVIQNKNLITTSCKSLSVLGLISLIAYSINSKNFLNIKKMKKSEFILIHLCAMIGLISLYLEENNNSKSSLIIMNKLLNLTFFSELTIHSLNLLIKKFRTIQNSLKDSIFKNTGVENTKICAICREKPNIPISPCKNSYNHTFCEKCIYQWYKTNKSNTTSCPLCREEIHLKLSFPKNSQQLSNFLSNISFKKEKFIFTYFCYFIFFAATSLFYCHHLLSNDLSCNS